MSKVIRKLKCIISGAEFDGTFNTSEFDPLEKEYIKVFSTSVLEHLAAKSKELNSNYMLVDCPYIEESITAENDDDHENKSNDIANSLDVIVSKFLQLKAGQKSSSNNSNKEKEIERTNNNEILENFKKFAYTPQEIYKHLNDYIVSQDHAKKVLSVGVFNHYQRLLMEQESLDGSLDSNKLMSSPKSNILLVGPSGSGKTYMIQIIARLLDVPVAFGDATTLTEAGYVGEDVESLIQQLYRNSGNNIEKTECGIIFIDEFDKIRKKSNHTATVDVSGEAVQQALLKMMEGSKITVPVREGRRTPNSSINEIDTSKILFVCSGAFIGLEEIIRKRIDSGKNSIGFGSTLSSKKNKQNISELYKNVVSKDIIKYGFIPEIVGRLPVIASLEDHTPESLVKILMNTKGNILEQYNLLFKSYGVSLAFSEEAIQAAAKLAIEKEVGARGLKSLFEAILLNPMFNAPTVARDGKIKSVLVTKDCFTKDKEPEFSTKKMTSTIFKEKKLKNDNNNSKKEKIVTKTNKSNDKTEKTSNKTTKTKKSV